MELEFTFYLLWTDTIKGAGERGGVNGEKQYSLNRHLSSMYYAPTSALGTEN